MLHHLKKNSFNKKSGMYILLTTYALEKRQTQEKKGMNIF
jgi:hypothetical protein